MLHKKRRFPRWTWLFDQLSAPALNNPEIGPVNAKFAWEMLECEMHLQTEQRPDEVKAERLIQLYMAGVQHYDAISNPNANFFKKKLEALKKNLHYLNLLKSRAQTQRVSSDQLRRHTMDVKIGEALSPQALLQNLLHTSRLERAEQQQSIEEGIRRQKQAL